MSYTSLTHLKVSYRSRALFLLISLLALFTSNTSAAEIKDLKLERFELAQQLNPDINNGRKLYRLCITCHGPEGWGTKNGSYPQIAGQLHSVIIKQLGDISSKQRGNPIMEAFTSPRVLQSAQDVADLAAYIAQLPMTRNNGQGYFEDLSMGKQAYEENCSKCHGEQGEGQIEDYIPRIQGQHYNYLMRQFRWIRGGHRRNADKKMIQQVQHFSLREESAVMAYVASLQPAENDLAEAGWSNPDFPHYDRRWAPSSPRNKPLNQ
ncbi:MAG: c-type cytochrome [Gammaproteobacteria bacterium]|nr:c-type cytochrome [Gammaproteobacteria bacterium]